MRWREAIVAMSQLADEPSIVEAEINPLIVRTDGVVAVDALVKLGVSAGIIRAAGTRPATNAEERPCRTPKPSTPAIPPRARPTTWSASSRKLRHDALNDEVRHYARRHLLDTVGVMISGAQGNVATQAEAVLIATRPAGNVPVPGRARRADLIDAAFLGGTAAHGIELDDGYTKGSVHPGCTVVPAILSAGYVKKASGAQLIEAMVAGYETVTAIGRAVHPDLRHRGFHPTGAVAVFGAAMAVGKLRGLTPQQLSNALGIAGVELGRAVRLRQRRRRHQAAARRPRLARRACRRRCWPKPASKARPP